MKPPPKPTAAEGEGLLPRLFAGFFGAFLGLSLLKFGNPPIFERWVSAPADVYQFILWSPWPIAWAYWALGLVAVLGLLIARWRTEAPGWLVALPLVWLVWQCLAGTQTTDAALTRVTLQHFGACVACFYLGCFCLGRVQHLLPFWLGLLCGFLLVLAVGFEQQFGGLEATRRYFYLYTYPQLKAQMVEVPPELLKRVSSSRIFSTLFYPNALAGVLVLLLPALLAALWRMDRLLTRAARGFLITVVGGGGLACLYWSGSKGGWLLMLLLGLIVLLRLPLGRRFKIALVCGVLLAGVAGFLWKYSGFFRRGATSVTARFDYWRAGVRTAAANPLLGTGPGTFGIAYRRIRPPESEPAGLAHNDYLEQASDSGLPGFVVYAVFIAGALAYAAKLGWPSSDWQAFAVWLGVLGWALQGLLEFGLYLPALAWPAFALLGWLLGAPPARREEVAQASVGASPQ